MKKCINCGADIADDTIVCPKCGKQIASLDEMTSDVSKEAKEDQIASLQLANEEANNVFAILAVIFGALGGVAGLVLGIIGLKRYKTPGKRACCIIGIVLFAVWFVVAIALAAI